MKTQRRRGAPRTARGRLGALRCARHEMTGINDDYGDDDGIDDGDEDRDNVDHHADDNANDNAHDSL